MSEHMDTTREAPTEQDFIAAMDDICEQISLAVFGFKMNPPRAVLRVLEAGETR